MAAIRLVQSVARQASPLSVAAAARRALSLSSPTFGARVKTPLQDIPLEDDDHLLETDHATSISPPPPELAHPPPPVQPHSPHQKQLTEAQEARRKALPFSTKQLNRLLGSYKPYELKESDLEETFVRGSGAGGQVINKSSNSVSLIHKPTGLRVQCQETRSQQQNRKIARKLLAEQIATLDPTAAQPTRTEILAARAQLKKRRKDKKTRRKYKAASLEQSVAEFDRITASLEEPDSIEAEDLPLEGRPDPIDGPEPDESDLDAVLNQVEQASGSSEPARREA